MFLITIILSLLGLAFSSSLTISIDNKIINANTVYTLTLTRTTANAVDYLLLTMPNGTNGSNFTTSTVQINGTSAGFTSSTGNITFTSTNSLSFTIVITGVINPSSVINLNSSNVWISIGSEIITLTSGVSYSNGEPQSCNIAFFPTVSVVGTSTITINTTNPITTSKSYIQIEFPQYWTSTDTIGMSMNGSTTNSVTVSSVNITYINGSV